MVKRSIDRHILGMVGPTDLKRIKSAHMWYMANYVTYNFVLTHHLDPAFSLFGDALYGENTPLLSRSNSLIIIIYLASAWWHRLFLSPPLQMTHTHTHTYIYIFGTEKGGYGRQFY